MRYRRRASRGGTRRLGWNAISKKTTGFLADGCEEEERNARLLSAACDVAGCGVSREEALPRLLEAASKCRPPMDADEARKAVESAFSTPREPSSPSTASEEPEFASELWFARLLVTAHGRDLRHVGRWGKWLVWSEREGRWREDYDGEIVRRAKRVALKEAMAGADALAEALEAAKQESEGEGGGGSDFDPRKLVAKYQQKTPLTNAIALAASEPDVVAAADAWDADPWLLNVANGTLDLRTDELREHRREDLITKRSPVGFDPSAVAIAWEAFLERVLPDPEVRGYVQRFLGYSLSGDVGEHVLHILWGSGANGKSTLLETVMAVMGDYAAPAPSTLLMQAKGERHPTELATLLGRRFVVSSESPESGRLNENLVKSLTGGDTVTARRMREDFWSFKPTHKLALATNHRPRIVGTDEGIWRRVRLIPFAATIPEAERDPRLREKLDAEAEGILAWLVRGASAYRERGLESPEAVRVATSEYRDAEDTLAEFVEDRIVRAPGAFLPSRRLHEAYRRWCVDAGVPESRRLSQRSLTERLVDRGYVPKRTNKGRGFADIRITDVLDSIGDAAVTQGDASNRPASLRNALPGQQFASIGDAVTSKGPLMDQHARTHTHARTHADMPGDAALRHQRHRAEGAAVEDGAPDRQPRPCYSCRGRRFRRRGNGPWICDRCHPAPNRADPELAWADVPEDADDRE